MVENADGANDGGREAGDVELALFRRIRSLSNTTIYRRLLPTRAESLHRYITDPLSMFTSPSNPPSADPESSVDDNSDRSQDPTPDHPVPSDKHPDPPADDTVRRRVSAGAAWRDALVAACAELLGRTLDTLREEHAASAASSSAFPPDAASFEPAARDFADFVIMATLRGQDAFAMQNATSWLFNMMDRTGGGYVLRDEFVRYAPFIGPVADAAVAGLVFDELLLEQARRAAEDGQEGAVSAAGGRDGKGRRAPEGLRRRRGGGREDDGAADAHADGTDTRREPSRDLFPPAVALRYDTWRPFFEAIQDKYHYDDADWVAVKQQLGIDPAELLIKSQGALDHSDVFPTLGKLYLSQRYLVFYAAVGRNHYVVRLGAVAEVSTMAIPIMMRDCLKIILESETQAAMDGVSAPPQEDADSSAPDGKRPVPDSRNETLSQHVGRLMRQYTAGRKPLLFSLLEFRERKRRDNWVNLVMEMIAAHKLHVQLGFGSSGRAVPSVAPALEGDAPDTEPEAAAQTEQVRTLNYARSPFRNEPSPPLLAVAAHANIVRYRSLRRVTRKRVSPSLLLFSHAERNTQLVNWYTDSVRAFQGQSSRTWIERALSAIRENMDTNDRIYRVKDDEPFDVGRLGDAIGRFAELCAPLVRVIQLFNHLFQWRNPPATILAILACIFIAANGLVHYVPAVLVFLQAAWIVETKYNWLGLGMGRTETEDAERRQANVLALVAQVHDTLAAAQNVLGRLNRELGKVQLLFLWGSEEWQSWAAVGALCGVGLVLLVVPAQTIFLCGMFFMFFKHFLPPTNPGLKCWQSIPSRGKRKKRERAAAVAKKIVNEGAARKSLAMEAAATNL